MKKLPPMRQVITDRKERIMTHEAIQQNIGGEGKMSVVKFQSEGETILGICKLTYEQIKKAEDGIIIDIGGVQFYVRMEAFELIVTRSDIVQDE